MFRLSDFVLPALGLVVLGTGYTIERLTDRSDPPGPVHIKYWEKWTGFEFDAMKAVVDDYNASQNRVHVDILSTSDINNKTMLATSAGVPPDVAGLYGPNVPQYVDDQAIQPLDDFCREKWIKASDYIPSIWQIGVYNDHVYALPSVPATTALHYNTDLLKAAGISKPPETIEEMKDMVLKLTQQEKNGSLKVAGFLPAEPGWWNFDWGYVFGGRLWDGKGKITANSPENVQGYSWVQWFSKQFGPAQVQTFKSGFGNFSSPQNAFLEGKVAMELQGVWMSNFIHMYNPKLQWAAAPFPYPKDRPDLKDMTFVDADVLTIPRGARHPKEAFDFISFVQTQKEMEKLCYLQQKNSPLTTVSQEFWQKAKNPYLQLFYQLSFSKNAVLPPRIGIWTQYQDELNNAFDEISLMQKTPQQALDDVTARMQPKLDQYLERRARRQEIGL